MLKKTKNYLTFKIEVDGAKSFQELIEKAKFDWINPDVNEKNFPIKQKTKHIVTIKLFNFNRFISSEEVIKNIKKNGFRPAFIEELIVLATNYPDLQKKFPVVALGSMWNKGNNHFTVPEIYWHGPGHSLSICGQGGESINLIKLITSNLDFYR